MLQSSQLHQAQTTATTNTCRICPTLGFQVEHELMGLIFVMPTHSVCTLIAAPSLPLTLQESPAPIIAYKTLPSEDCQERACMTQHVQCQTLRSALAWKHPSYSQKHFCTH